MLKDISQGVINSLLLAAGLTCGVAASAQTRILIKNLPPIPRPNSIIHVNPVLGNDLTGKGSLQSPYRSITHALGQSKFSSTIKLAPGTYTIANGEIFPIQLKPGVIILGNELKFGQNTVILGGGSFLSPTLSSQNIAVLGADQAEIRGVTVTNRNPRGYGLWLEGTNPKIISSSFSGNTQDGILVLGKSSALISKNIFNKNGANGMSIEGIATPEINGNRFENTGYGMIVRQNAAPKILGNTLINNRSGILIQPSSSPVLRGNVIEQNQQTGITILGNSSPDLGTVDSPGNNIVQNNQLRDIQYTGIAAIAAVGNQIIRIAGNLQLSGQSTNQASIANVPVLPLSNNVTRLPSQNEPIRTVIPNSIIVRNTLPGESAQPLPSNTKIDPSLPPIALAPPSGAFLIKPTNKNINRTITISRAKPTPTVTLRYRVVVSSKSETSKLEIRRIVPNAFTARFNGQEVIQVGAFSDRTAADEQVKKLAEAGFNAEIEPITTP